MAAGYPTTLGRKIYETDESVTYSASNAEFGDGYVTLYHDGFASIFKPYGQNRCYRSTFSI
jgi:hypothetical protein